MTRLLVASEQEVSDTFQRQLGLCHPNQLKAFGQVALIGAGGIGSWTGLGLAKMGLETLTVYDADSVEVHNQPNQLYGESHVGKTKVEALHEVVELLAPTCSLIVDTEEVGPGKAGIAKLGRAECIISGVDSFQARTDIWRIVQRTDAHWYMDGRMRARVAVLYCVRLDDPEARAKYEATLLSDVVGQEGPCTERSIAYTPMHLAAIICDNVAKLATGSGVPPFEEVFDFVTRTHLVS